MKWLLAGGGAVLMLSLWRRQPRWAWPLESCRRISSPWGARPNPFTSESPKTECHGGLDLPCATGASVVSTRGGTVIRADFSSASAGGLIIVRHPDNTLAKYMHLSALFVSVGDLVSQGQRLGSVGSTGRSTGPHLHFEIRDPLGRSIDPGPLLGVTAGTPC